MPTWSSITTTEIDQAMRYFATLPRPFRLSVLDRQSEIARHKRKAWADAHGGKVSAEFYERALGLAALEMRERERGLGRKNQNLDPEELAEIHRLRLARAAKIKSKGYKKARLIRIRYWSLIQQLREQDGLSWRGIADFLKKYNKFKASHTYIKQVWEAETLKQKME